MRPRLWTRWILSLGLLSAQPLLAQTPGNSVGWRTDLLTRADGLRAPLGSPAATPAAINEAIAGIEAMDLPAEARSLADSLVMELHARSGYLYLQAEQPAQAVLAYRSALERSARSPALLDRAKELTDALAEAQIRAGEGPEALRTYDEAIGLAEARKDSISLRYFLVRKGIRCAELSEYQQAIDINETILAMDLRSNDILDRIGTELRLSGYHEKLNSTEAFEHANEAYKLAEQSGNDRDLLDACDLLIRSYQTTSENEECRSRLDQALAKAKDRGVPSEIARFHDRYGRYEVREGRPAEAIAHFKQGLEALGRTVPADNPTTGNAQADKHLAELLLDMGRCYRDQRDTAQALLHLAECERLVTANPALSVAPWADLGELHFQMNDVGRAAAYGVRALRIGEQNRDAAMQHRASGLLYQVYKRQGDPAKALAMHERYLSTLLSKEKETYMLDLQKAQIQLGFQQIQYADSLEAARVQEELRVDAGIARARNRYLAGGGILLFLSAAIVAFIDRKRRAARFDKEAAQLETQALRSQMNPHFIFNALNSINAFVQRNEPDRAASFLSRFARLMRLVLENSRQSEVPLKDDLEALDAYLHLERARSGEKFDYRIQVAPDIDQEDVMVPPLVAQPFVENAIWHGMAGKEEKGHITLSVSRKGDQLLFTIEDDGVGRHAPTRPVPDASDGAGGFISKKTSLGTAITKARLDLVRQQKGKAAGFAYVDLPQGTRVELTLPFSTAS